MYLYSAYSYIIGNCLSLLSSAGISLDEMHWSVEMRLQSPFYYSQIKDIDVVIISNDL